MSTKQVLAAISYVVITSSIALATPDEVPVLVGIAIMAMAVSTVVVFAFLVSYVIERQE